MIKPSEKILEAQQGRDLRQIDLRDKYEQDLVTIQRCIDQLDIARQQRTYEYEQEYLKIDREYEERVLKFDERREAEPLEVENG
jgi:hypothetical protein